MLKIQPYLVFANGDIYPFESMRREGNDLIFNGIHRRKFLTDEDVKIQMRKIFESLEAGETVLKVKSPGENLTFF